MTDKSYPPDKFEVGELAYYVADGTKIYKHKILSIENELRLVRPSHGAFGGSHLLPECRFYKNYWDAYAEMIKRRKVNEKRL